jgi:hypothetical protein
MKTKIIRLEPHDDFISARDKMGWSQTERILLVWPEGSHILFRRLDLTLLQRHSTNLGAQLALVAEDSDVRYNADQLEIPVFRTIQSAQKSSWRISEQRTPPQINLQRAGHKRPDLVTLAQDAHPQPSKILTQPTTRLVLFTLGVLALLSIAAMLVPKVTIALTPDTRIQNLTLLVRANPGAETVNMSGEIPARLITVEVEGRSSMPTSGSIKIPQDYATGLVRFTNLTDRSLTIPPQTVVRKTGTPPTRFVTTNIAQLPSGVGETITVTVQAIEPGISGNVHANQLIAIEGELGASLSSTNPKPTSGGGERVLSTATQNDRDQLLKQLVAELAHTAQDELIRQMLSGDILFTPTITVAQVVEQVYEPPENLPSDEIGLSLRVEYQALAASQADLMQLAQYALDANLPHMFVALPESTEIEIASSPIVRKDSTIEWKINAIRQLRAWIQESEAINLSLGMPPAVAAQKLVSQLPILSPPLIQLTPSWWPRLPILPFRYTISIAQ